MQSKQSENVTDHILSVYTTDCYKTIFPYVTAIHCFHVKELGVNVDHFLTNERVMLGCLSQAGQAVSRMDEVDRPF